MRSMAAVVGRETRAFFNLGNFTDNGRNLGCMRIVRAVGAQLPNPDTQEVLASY